MLRGKTKRLNFKLLLGDLCDCDGSEESIKKILRSHICEFFIYIIRNKILVYRTVWGEVWKAEAEDNSKCIVSATMSEADLGILVTRL